jgi:hypothetical protein
MDSGTFISLVCEVAKRQAKDQQLSHPEDIAAYLLNATEILSEGLAILMYEWKVMDKNL